MMLCVSSETLNPGALFILFNGSQSRELGLRGDMAKKMSFRFNISVRITGLKKKKKVQPSLEALSENV